MSELLEKILSKDNMNTARRLYQRELGEYQGTNQAQGV